MPFSAINPQQQILQQSLPMQGAPLMAPGGPPAVDQQQMPGMQPQPMGMGFSPQQMPYFQRAGGIGSLANRIYGQPSQGPQLGGGQGLLQLLQSNPNVARLMGRAR